MADYISDPDGKGLAGGLGSLKSIGRIYAESEPPAAFAETLARQNKSGGLICVSCAWPKPKNYHPFESCENGAKATMWEVTNARCTPDFRNEHSATELRSWNDHDLEMTGRLTHPMRLEVTWDETFEKIGKTPRRPGRQSVVFETSGHAGLEATYLYALLARAYRNNNLPQSSNMCHETTSVGLNKVIGSPVEMIICDDLEEADAFFFFGQNPGTMILALAWSR